MRKYTQTGSVLLSTRRREGHVYLQVWDTGVGIPMAEQQKIFDDFYRWENNQEPGMGLGLGLVRRMQKQLNLTTEVHSVPNKGSRFGIYIPLAKQSQAPTPVATASPVVNTDKSAQCKVWCIDDDVNNLTAISTLLSHWQCECQTFNRYGEALEASGEAELLLVDYHLDNSQDGLDLIQRLRDKAGKTIPAVLITALRDADLVEACKQQQVTYMAKPAKPAKLRALIQHIHQQKSRR